MALKLRRRWRSMGRLIFGAALLFVLAVGWGWISSLWVRVDTVTWIVPEWKNAAMSMRLIIVSDPHWKPGDGEKVQKLVESLNAEEVDAVLLLGDFPYGNDSQSGMDPKQYAALLKKCRHPMYVVLGNHDSLYGYETVRDAFLAESIPVLQAESVMLYGDHGETLQLGGVDDILTRRDDVLRLGVPKRKRADVPYILMSHTHYIASIIKPESRPTLVVSGHTHGGQICLPGGTAVGELVGNLRSDEVMSGLQYVKSQPVLISRGLGYSILPIRLFCPPQLIILELKSGSVKAS